MLQVMEHTLLYLFGAIMFAGFLQTVSGFGYALAAVPLLMFIMNPKDAVMLVLITGALLKVVMIYRTRSVGNFRAILPLFLASLLGALPGAYVLKVIDDNLAKIFVSITLILVAIAMSCNYRIEIKRPRLASGIVGIASGFLGSTTSFSGPPVVLYMLNDNVTNKETIRANLTRFFILGNLVSIVFGYFFGTLHIETLTKYILVSIPALLIGFWLGDKLFTRMNAAAFRRLAIWLITLSGLATIVGSGLTYFKI